MFVSQSMTTGVITADPGDSIISAQEKMARHHVRHLPVVENGNILVGIVSDRDIRSALPESILKVLEFKDADIEKIRQLTIANVMTKDPVSLSTSDTIQDALLMIQKYRVGALPVVNENNHLKGILSTRDLLRAFINVMGIEEPGTLLGILVENKLGQLKKIVDAITEEHISTGSVLVARHWEENKRAVFPYLLAMNISGVKEKMLKLGFELINPMDWYIDKIKDGEENRES